VATERRHDPILARPADNPHRAGEPVPEAAQFLTAWNQSIPGAGPRRSRATARLGAAALARGISPGREGKPSYQGEFMLGAADQVCVEAFLALD
jgi:hypothetical protein